MYFQAPVTCGRPQTGREPAVMGARQHRLETSHTILVPSNPQKSLVKCSECWTSRAKNLMISPACLTLSQTDPTLLHKMGQSMCYCFLPFMYEWILPFGLILWTWDGPLCTLRGHRLWFPNKIIFSHVKITFVIANSVDPDEMPHIVAFHLCLHRLPKYLFMRPQYTKGWTFIWSDVNPLLSRNISQKKI